MSQCADILAVLQSRPGFISIGEIHDRVGPCRLNSRIAELRDKGHNIVSKTESTWNATKRRRENTYWYCLVGSALDSETPHGRVRGGVSESSAAGGLSLPSSSPPPVGRSLDERGVLEAAAELNREFPGMLLEDGVPVGEVLPIEVQRVELAKLQQTLFGDRQAA